MMWKKLMFFKKKKPQILKTHYLDIESVLVDDRKIYHSICKFDLIENQYDQKALELEFFAFCRNLHKWGINKENSWISPYQIKEIKLLKIESKKIEGIVVVTQ